MYTLFFFIPAELSVVNEVCKKMDLRVTLIRTMDIELKEWTRVIVQEEGRFEKVKTIEKELSLQKPCMILKLVDQTYVPAGGKKLAMFDLMKVPADLEIIIKNEHTPNYFAYWFNHERYVLFFKDLENDPNWEEKMAKFAQDNGVDRRESGKMLKLS